MSAAPLLYNNIIEVRIVQIIKSNSDKLYTEIFPSRTPLWQDGRYVSYHHAVRILDRNITDTSVARCVTKLIRPFYACLRNFAIGFMNTSFAWIASIIIRTNTALGLITTTISCARRAQLHNLYSRSSSINWYAASIMRRPNCWYSSSTLFVHVLEIYSKPCRECPATCETQSQSFAFMNIGIGRTRGYMKHVTSLIFRDCERLRFILGHLGSRGTCA